MLSDLLPSDGVYRRGHRFFSNVLYPFAFFLWAFLRGISFVLGSL